MVKEEKRKKVNEIFPYLLRVKRIEDINPEILEYENVGMGIEIVSIKEETTVSSSSGSLGYGCLGYTNSWMKEKKIYLYLRTELSFMGAINFVELNDWFYEQDMDYCKELKMKKIYLDKNSINKSYTSNDKERFLCLLVKNMEKIFRKV